MINKVLVSIIIILIPFCLFILIKNYNQSDDNNIPDDNNSKIIVNVQSKDNIYTLDLNDYLIGVVGAEMPASFNSEALKAQAIASRTFALYDNNLNIINTVTSEQAYNTNEELKVKWNTDYDKYYTKIKDAVNNTDSLVIKYDGELIKSYYYAMSNGYTEDCQAVFNETYPYLNVVSSDFDANANNYLYQKKFTNQEFCDALSISCNNIVISNAIKDDSNRISSININDKTFTGIEVRKLLNLRSTDFSITLDNDQVLIETKGYGHGVGMSQYGANYLANNGQNYETILKYYYQNVEIVNY